LSVFVVGHAPGCASVDLVAVGRSVHAVKFFAVNTGTVVTTIPTGPNIESGGRSSTLQASQRAAAFVPRWKSVGVHPTVIRPSKHSATHPQLPNALPIRLLIAIQANRPSLNIASDSRRKEPPPIPPRETTDGTGGTKHGSRCVDSRARFAVS
jgi:hypothetical protein